MNLELRAKLRNMLLKHEGLRLHPYQDSVGKTTIGVGRCLTTRGISESEAFILLDDDMMWFTDKLTATFPWFSTLDENRQAALIDMTFNLGMNGFLEFKEMISALDRHDFEQASEHLLQSKYAEQVGMRAHDLAEIIRTGIIHV